MQIKALFLSLKMKVNKTILKHFFLLLISQQKTKIVKCKSRQSISNLFKTVDFKTIFKHECRQEQGNSNN